MGQVRSYTRRTKSGKRVTVKGHGRMTKKHSVHKLNFLFSRIGKAETKSNGWTSYAQRDKMTKRLKSLNRRKNIVYRHMQRKR